MIIVTASVDSEAGKLPSEELMAAMGKFNEELVNAGIMLAGEGLRPSRDGARVRFAGERREVTLGPFAHTRELVSGYWLWQVGSTEEAIEWVKRCPSGRTSFHEWTSHLHDMTLDSIERLSGEKRKLTSDLTTDTVVTITGGQKCTVEDRSGQNCCEYTPGSVPFGPTCTNGCTPVSRHTTMCTSVGATFSETDYFQTDVQDFHSTLHREGTVSGAPPSANFKSDRNLDSSVTRQLKVIWTFDGLPAGAQIPVVKVESSGILPGIPPIFTGTPESSPMQMVEPPAEVALPQVQFVSPGTGCTSLGGGTSASSITWRLAGPTRPRRSF